MPHQPQLVFIQVVREKPENLKKTPRSKARTNNKLDQHMAQGQNRLRDCGRQALPQLRHSCMLLTFKSKFLLPVSQ